MVRKFLIVLLSIWFPPATSMPTRCLSLALLTLVAFALTCWHKPYMLSKLNTLDVATQFGTLVSILLAIYVDSLQGSSQTNVSSRVQAATAMFVLINLGILSVHNGMCMKSVFMTVKELFAAGASKSITLDLTAIP